jgi:hypothetical protein
LLFGASVIPGQANGLNPEPMNTAFTEQGMANAAPSQVILLFMGSGLAASQRAGMTDVSNARNGL